MDYNEFDDYGTGYEEQAEAMHDAMVDTQIAIIRDEQILAFFAPRSCAAKTCWIGDNHTNDCLPF